MSVTQLVWHQLCFHCKNPKCISFRVMVPEQRHFFWSCDFPKNACTNNYCSGITLAHSITDYYGQFNSFTQMQPSASTIWEPSSILQCSTLRLYNSRDEHHRDLRNLDHFKYQLYLFLNSENKLQIQNKVGENAPKKLFSFTLQWNAKNPILVGGKPIHFLNEKLWPQVCKIWG